METTASRSLDLIARDIDRIEVVKMVAIAFAVGQLVVGVIGAGGFAIDWLLFLLSLASPDSSFDGTMYAYEERGPVVLVTLASAIGYALLSLFALKGLTQRAPYVRIALVCVVVALFVLIAASGARPAIYQLRNWDSTGNVIYNTLFLVGLVVLTGLVLATVAALNSATRLVRDSTSQYVLGRNPKVFSAAGLDQLLSIPSTVAIMERGRGTTRLLFLFHACVAGLATVIPFVCSVLLVYGQKIIQDIFWKPNTTQMFVNAEHFYLVYTAAGVVLVSTPLIAAVLYRLANKALNAARSRVRVSMDRLRTKDTRPPILFLRSFHDDQVQLPKRYAGLWGSLMKLGSGRTVLDHLLVEELSGLRPVVALGSPADKIPPFGAARGYFEGNSWQAGVKALMAESACIVLVVDDTPGTWWEIEQIAADPKLLEKTLFLAHPQDLKSGRASELWQRLEKAAGYASSPSSADGPAPQSRGPACLAQYFGGNSRFAWAAREYGRTQYLLTIREFAGRVLGEQTAPAAVSAAQPAPAMRAVDPEAYGLAAWRVWKIVGFALLSGSAAELLAVLGVSVRVADVQMIWLLPAALLLPIVLMTSKVTGLLGSVALTAYWLAAGFVSNLAYGLLLQASQTSTDTMFVAGDLAFCILFTLMTVTAFHWTLRLPVVQSSWLTALAIGALGGCAQRLIIPIVLGLQQDSLERMVASAIFNAALVLPPLLAVRFTAVRLFFCRRLPSVHPPERHAAWLSRRQRSACRELARSKLSAAAASVRARLRYHGAKEPERRKR